MDLVDLIVLVCTLATPIACEERHLLFESEGSLRACMMHAPPHLAQYMSEHPNLRVARWRCDWPEREKRPT